MGFDLHVYESLCGDKQRRLSIHYFLEPFVLPINVSPSSQALLAHVLKSRGS